MKIQSNCLSQLLVYNYHYKSNPVEVENSLGKLINVIISNSQTSWENGKYLVHLSEYDFNVVMIKVPTKQ